MKSSLERLSMDAVKGSKEYPYHLSIGAVLLDGDDQVCVHHFGEIEHGGRKADDFFILMRETPERDETNLETLARGLREEFGASATVRHFVGSIVCDPGLDNNREKTTLYFLCDLVAQDVSTRVNTDIEFQSKIEWHPIDFMIEKMKGQRKFGYADIDESSLLERVRLLISS